MWSCKSIRSVNQVQITFMELLYHCWKKRQKFSCQHITEHLESREGTGHDWAPHSVPKGNKMVREFDSTEIMNINQHKVTRYQFSLRDCLDFVTQLFQIHLIYSQFIQTTFFPFWFSFLLASFTQLRVKSLFPNAIVSGAQEEGGFSSELTDVTCYLPLEKPRSCLLNIILGIRLRTLGI